MSFEEIRAVFTCGMCETICEDYFNHSCLEDYDDVHLDDNYYFYPLLADKQTIIRRAVLPNGTEGLIEDKIFRNKENCNPNSIMSPPATKKPKKGRNATATKGNRKKLSDEETEQLIIEVQSRIPLWNFSIPLEERSRDIKAELWEEVSAALNGKLNATEAKTKFKNIRDTYRKIIQAEHHASGSAAVSSEDSWKFYQCCEFLRDSCLLKDTSSNVMRESVSERFSADVSLSVDDSLSDAGDDILGRSQAYGGASHSKKRRKSYKDDAGDSASAISRLVDVLGREAQPVNLPEPPKIDTVGAYMIGLGHQIRQLPQRVQTDILKQLTDIVYEAIKQNL